MSFAWRLRSSWGISLVRSSSIRPISLVMSSESGERPAEGDMEMEWMPGRTFVCMRGDEWFELGVDSRDSEEGDDDLYILLRGGNLNWMSPDVKRGYSEPGLDEDDAVDAEGRCSASGNFGSTGGGGRAGNRDAPGTDLSGIIARIDLEM